MKHKRTFSGHETFHCRTLWLKKGYDFLTTSGNRFANADAIVELGVGKNMVSAIRYWMRSCAITDEQDVITEFGHNLLHKDTGLDPFLENTISLWLLHYNLVTHEKASLYSLVFNTLRRRKAVFTKKDVIQAIEHECRQHELVLSANTIEADVDVFVKMYKSVGRSTNIEDDCSGLFVELGLLSEIRREDSSEVFYHLHSSKEVDVPAELVLFVLLQDTSRTSFQFDMLLHNAHAPGSIFLFTPDTLLEKIQELEKLHRGEIIYTSDAGVREVQMKNNNFDQWKVLRTCYDKYRKTAVQSLNQY